MSSSGAFACLVSLLTVSLLIQDYVKVTAYTRKKNSFITKRKTTWRKVVRTSKTTEEVLDYINNTRVWPWNTQQYYDTEYHGPPTTTETFIYFLRHPNGTDPIYYPPNITAQDRLRRLEKVKGRANRTDWCKCGGCPAMATDEDSYCCRDEYYFNKFISFVEGPNAKCFADTALTAICLRHVDLNIYRNMFLSENKRHLEVQYNVNFRNLTNQLWRWLAYRLIIRRLNNMAPYDDGRFNGTIPACFVNAVRGEYPEPSGVYPDTGWSIFNGARLPG